MGEGGFGSVWRCKGEGVVVKLVRVDLERDVNALRVLDELDILGVEARPRRRVL